MSLRRKEQEKRMMFLNSKKGNVVSDGLLIVVAVFLLSIFFLVSFKAFDDIKPTLDSEGFSANTTAVYTDMYNDMENTLDAAIITVLVLLWAGAVILSFFIDTHPVFFIFSIVLLVGIVIVGMILSNTYATIFDDLGMGSNFPMTSFLFDNFLAFIFAVVFSIMLSLYAKTKL